MRDGVYKDLAMPRPWKGLLKSAERKAERGEICAQKATRAMEADARRELSIPFLRRLKQLIEIGEVSLPIIGGPLSRIASPREMGGNNTPLEQLVLDCARWREIEGSHDRSLGQAICDALTIWDGRQFRLMQQHCLIKAGVDSLPLLQATRAALDKIDRNAMANRLATGAPPARFRVKPIDPDEDLTRRK